MPARRMANIREASYYVDVDADVRLRSAAALMVFAGSTLSAGPWVAGALRPAFVVVTRYVGTVWVWDGMGLLRAMAFWCCGTV